MKSILSLVLTLFMITSLFASPAVISGAESVDLPFSDVSESDWFYDNVKYVYENGIMEGVENKKFAPVGELSRAMGVTILYRMAGEPDVGNIQHRFNDVKAGAWYSDAVAWGYENGIVKGRSDTEFSPNDKVTRAEFIVFLTRYAYYAEVELPAKRTGEFEDSMLTPDFAKDAEKLMYESEVLLGQQDNMFLPYAWITRAETAALLERFVKNSVKIDTDKYTYIVFMGNSITQTGNTALHFGALAEDKNVKAYAYDHCEGLVTKDHYEWFTSDLHPDRKIAEKADVVILQEAGGSFPTIGNNKEIQKLVEDRSNLPGGFPNGFCSGENYVEKMMDLLGRDKEYYAYTAASFIGVFDENDTEILLKIKDICAEDYDLSLVYVSDVSAFNKDLNLSDRDTFPDGLHPTRLMGYCVALAMYCEIYDVPAAEQNNGDLKPDEIPGGTQAEKDAFMAMLKDTVQAILDIQK